MRAPAVLAGCTGCGGCLRTCPEHAIRPAAGPARLVILASRCTGCGECVEVCPADVIDVPVMPGRAHDSR